MSVDQLIAKALSTSSEDEAIACLRMARKKGGKIITTSSVQTLNGQDINTWARTAKYYHNLAVQHERKARELKVKLDASFSPAIVVALLFLALTQAIFIITSF